jgi:hypothetical protein
MKVNGTSVDLLQRKLSRTCIGFDLNKVEMVHHRSPLPFSYVILCFPTKMHSNIVITKTISPLMQVMIHVLHNLQWWLIVANIRDKWFDVLSSVPFTNESREVTEVVVRITISQTYFELCFITANVV